MKPLTLPPGPLNAWQNELLDIGLSLPKSNKESYMLPSEKCSHLFKDYLGLHTIVGESTPVSSTSRHVPPMFDVLGVSQNHEEFLGTATIILDLGQMGGPYFLTAAS